MKQTLRMAIRTIKDQVNTILLDLVIALLQIIVIVLALYSKLK